jgi:hypothetical protein
MTTDARHSKQTVSNGGIHGIVAYVYANNAARLAATGFVPEDIYKVAIEIDSGDLYILVDDSPIEWVFFGNASELNRVAVKCIHGGVGTLAKGRVVYATGYDTTELHAIVEEAKADSPTTLPAVGFIETPCSDTVEGTLLIVGVLHEVDTSSWSAQDPLYVSETTAGDARNSAPSGPYVTQALGVVLNSHPTLGRIGVNVLGYRAYDYVNTPSPLGVAATGTRNVASPSDHVHLMPKLDDLNSPDDNTDLNATTSAHGLLPKLGGGTTDFLRADGSWAPAYSGVGFQSAVSEGESSTTSATFQQKVRITTPSLEAGTYYIGWSCEISSNADEKQNQVQVELDDTTQLAFHHEETKVKYVDSEWRTVSGFWVGSLTAAAHTIDLDYRTLNDTIYIRRARLVMWRIA